MPIIRARTEHIDQVAELFDLYRQFYEQPANPDLAHDFIRLRIVNKEADIFVAIEDGQAAGFVQLYPSFCSVEAVKRLILYDLFVAQSFRRRGLAEALMTRAAQFAIETGAARIDLETAIDNHAGQALYEKLGYQRANEGFYAYSLSV